MKTGFWKKIQNTLIPLLQNFNALEWDSQRLDSDVDYRFKYSLEIPRTTHRVFCLSHDDFRIWLDRAHHHRCSVCVIGLGCCQWQWLVLGFVNVWFWVLSMVGFGPVRSWVWALSVVEVGFSIRFFQRRCPACQDRTSIFLISPGFFATLLSG